MTLLEDAVGANVAWCARVSGGPGTEPHPGCWLAPPDPPPFFPDLVTLRPLVSATDVAAALRDRPVCSVKDSWADVDLTSSGFRMLLEATWIGRAAAGEPAAAPTGWGTVTTPAELGAWSVAAGLPESLPVALLDAPEVAVLARRRAGRLVAGATANRWRGAVGLTNVAGDDPWADLLAMHAGADVTGYEHGDELVAACAAGMVPLGPLRIWVRQSPSDGPAGASAPPAC
ncbi:hypothetical protein SAMN05660199_04315 [Klenkia soli]|uniref:Uncharacterized protein n=1 Tax=Klenkia soli TaxID=1052260 RepID=A0A1H0TZ61_9ACTN|nr:hypothetical protein [Klenkia soli]SDP59060.1 hypothetical protein SAMN05660199_04315 [Klenkia soli]